MVAAFIVLPTASREFRVVDAWPEIPDISAIPAALSVMGPKVSEAMMNAMTKSVPMLVMTRPYKDCPVTQNEAATATRTAIIGNKGVESPVEIPVIRLMAGPACEDSAT